MQVATRTDAEGSIGAFTFSIMLAKESELALSTMVGNPLSANTTSPGSKSLSNPESVVN
jgi:hypothetical protein